MCKKLFLTLSLNLVLVIPAAWGQAFFEGEKNLDLQRPTFQTFYTELMQWSPIQNFGLKTIISNRCRRYSALYKIPECLMGTDEMVKMLDLKMIILNSNPDIQGWDKQNFLATVFTKNLKTYLNQPSLSPILELIENLTYQTALNNKPAYKIYEIILKETKQNRELSLSLMATLFQDTTYGQAHIEFLRQEVKNPSVTFEKNLDLLSQTIDHLNSIRENSVEIFNQIIYPPNQQELSPSPYHFYVPQYLAYMLKKNGYSDQMARALPQILTMSYEFATINFESKGLQKQYLFKDPTSLDPLRYSWKIRDIVTGHAGAREGVGLKSFKSFSTISRLFKSSTAQTIKALLE